MQIKIEKLDHQFRGIGYCNGKVVFVPRVIPEEVCEIEIVKDKKKFMEGQVLEIIHPSAKRKSFRCPYYSHCGGCDLQHISYDESVLWKENMLCELLEKNDLWYEKICVVPSKEHYAYRNKVTLKVEQGKLGFYSPLTHELVEISNCMISSAAINRVIKDFSMYAFQNGELMIRSNENEEILMDIVTTDEVKIDASFANRHKLVGIMVNHRCVYGKSYFFERKNGVLYQVSFDSFFQVNPYISTELFLYIKKCLKNSFSILDLYCGVGTLGFQVYQSGACLTGIEVVPNAILNAIKNAKLNHITAQFHLGKVENIIFHLSREVDAVIVDPPRAGLDSNTKNVLFKLLPKTILYVSCNPQTLIRDLKDFQNHYRLLSVQGFDMFPFTKHVECVVLLSLKKSVK